MAHFKSLDIRGLTFTDAFQLTQREFRGIRTNGILEILLDKRRNFIEAFQKWAYTNGHNCSDVEEDTRMIRVFIKKRQGREKSN